MFYGIDISFVSCDNAEFTALSVSEILYGYDACHSAKTIYVFLQIHKHLPPINLGILYLTIYKHWFTGCKHSLI